MDKTVLEQIGLSKGESEVYLILLKIGQTSASEIAKHTKIARPNVYDYLNKLKEKGLISFITKKNKIHYIASSPEKVLDYINEKRDLLKENLPALLNIYKTKKEKTNIKVYEGAEGLKTLMNDVIKTGKDFVGWGASQKIKEHLPEFFIKRYLKQRKDKNIRAKQLFVETEGVLKNPVSKFKSIPKEFSSPATTITYGNKVAIVIYLVIPIIIIIKSKELSQSYKKHFEYLWKKTKN